MSGVCRTIERELVADHLRIAYRECDAGGSPILYIHGNTAGSLWFERVMVNPGYRTISPDMPNFGRSDRIDEADIDRYADSMATFCRSLGVDAAYVVGHSLGGAVAISLAVRYLPLVSRILLVDPAPVSGFHTPEKYYAVIDRYTTDRTLLKRALSAVVPTLRDEAFLDRLTDNALLMNTSAFTGNARALDRFDYSKRVGAVTVPVLVVRGELDALITAEAAEATAAAFPYGAYRELPGVGHSVMVEAPQRFSELVAEFGRR